MKEVITNVVNAVVGHHDAVINLESASKAVDEWCRANIHSRYYAINFKSARSSKAADHAGAIGVPILQIKKAVEFKDEFDKAVVEALMLKGLSEADAKSRKDQVWQNITRHAPSNPKGHKARAAAAAAKTAGKTAAPADPKPDLTTPDGILAICNALIGAMHEMADKDDTTAKRWKQIAELQMAVVKAIAK